MHYSRSVGILFAVATLIVSLAVPAAAKPGGHPGPPSGTGLEVTVQPSSVFMWANSVGDEILFDITVTNTSGGDLTEVTVTFGSDILLAGGSLTKNESWEMKYTDVDPNPYTYNVVEGDFEDAPISVQTQVPVGTVEAGINGTVMDSADAVMMAYPIIPCVQDPDDGSFTFGPNEDYAECSFTGTGDWDEYSGYWELITTLDTNRPPRGKSDNPSATVRDGVPGNWCATGGSVTEGYTVTDYQFFPDDGVCPGGGAGGDTIPVRNTNTFYLATWKGNFVEATPLLSLPPSP